MVIFVPTALITHLMMWGMSTDPNIVIPSIAYLITWVSTVGLILLCSLIGYIYAKAYRSHFSYQLSDRYLVITRGVFTREKTTIPFSRVQNINVGQGIIERRFGLYTVKVETAGSSGVNPNGGPTAPEGYITGIRNPQKLEAIINDLVHEYTQKPFQSKNLEGKIFDQPDLAFDEFMSYFLSKLVEGGAMKTRIKELREKAKISQADMADKVGVTRQTINYIENGKIIPSLLVAKKVADILEVKIDELFFFESTDLTRKEKKSAKPESS